MTRLASIFFSLTGHTSVQWDAVEAVLRKADLSGLLREMDWLKPDALYICHLRSFPDYRRLTKDGHLRSAEPRMCTWGIAWNGLCFTQPVQEEKGVGEGCSLSQILIPDAPERYFLSAKQMEKLLYRSHTDTSGMSVLADNAEGEGIESDDACGKEAA